MAKLENRRITTKILQTDIETYQALQDISDYNPSNSAFDLAQISASYDQMQLSQTQETQAQATAAVKRDTATANEWAFHNKILGVKAQIAAQYGDDSAQVQSIGLKRKSDYKKPTRRTVKS